MTWRKASESWRKIETNTKSDFHKKERETSKSDAEKAAFGHEMTEADWASVGGLLTKYLELKHGAPLVALSVTHPQIEELKSELMNEERKFCFLCAHDCTILGTLTALGVEPYELPDSIETKAPIGVKNPV